MFYLGRLLCIPIKFDIQTRLEFVYLVFSVMLGEAPEIGDIFRFISLSAGVLTGLLTSFYLYRKYICHSYFSNRGIPGPEPHWLFGNLRDIEVANRHDIFHNWAKIYGDIFGIYEGPSPILVISNIDAIEQVCVKQFQCFQGHNIIPIAPGPEETDTIVSHMLWAQGEHWRRLRAASNPAFSTGKLKSYCPLVACSQLDFLKHLSEKAQLKETFDIRTSFQLLTLDIIAKVGFGVDFDAVRTLGEGNPILKNLRQMFEISVRPQLAMTFLRTFPALAYLGKIIITNTFKNLRGPFKCLGMLLELVGEILRNRLKNESARRQDLLQLLIDNSEFSKEAKSQGNKALLKERDIKSMEMLFFLAGYETSSSMLAYTAYLLALHQNVQDKLVEEIYLNYPKDSNDFKPDYETVMNSMPYLDMVVKEVLRIYPIGLHIVNRYVVKETSLCGIPLDENCKSVLVDIWTVHRNCNLWGPVDANEFYPERFSPENSVNRPDAAFLAFGYGPRQCIGMRLALFEMKLTLVNMLHRFRIIEPLGGYPEEGLTVSSRESSILVPIDGVPVRIVFRNEM